jgi:hypothetical protein
MKNYSFSFNKFEVKFYNFWPRNLFFFEIFTFVCLLEENKNAKSKVKYVKAPGSLSLLLTSKFRKKIAIIVLPSFKIKLFNNRSQAFPNFVQTSSKIFFFFQKAGYNKNKG